jgi:DNA-binding response OmpR family regulator
MRGESANMAGGANHDHGKSAASPVDNCKRVLVVDDNESSRKLCSAMLSRGGLVATEANNGDQAWEVLLGTPCDLVIIDYVMLKISGLALVRRMRAAGMMQPAILVSGVRNRSESLGNSRQGVDAFVAKPYSFYELMMLVDSLLHSPARGRFGQSSPANP